MRNIDLLRWPRNGKVTASTLGHWRRPQTWYLMSRKMIMLTQVHPLRYSTAHRMGSQGSPQAARNRQTAPLCRNLAHSSEHLCLGLRASQRPGCPLEVSLWAPEMSQFCRSLLSSVPGRSPRDPISILRERYVDVVGGGPASQRSLA